MAQQLSSPRDVNEIAQDLMLRAAVEFGVVKRRLLPATGIRPSVCNAKRCLEALRHGSIDMARKYLAYAEARDPGEWSTFAELVRAAIDSLKSVDRTST